MYRCEPHPIMILW